MSKPVSGIRVVSDEKARATEDMRKLAEEEAEKVS